MSNIAQADISRYYDLLHLWTRFNGGFRVYSGLETHTIHRWLNDLDTGEFSPATIHKLMLSSGIGGGSPIEALDAGCGYGGTMFAMHAAVGGRWHGITISARQCAVGRKIAREMDIANAVTFAHESFDEPQTGSYNLIYGIESLIHSFDPSRTIGRLVQSLRSNGTFIIVDDMPADQVPPEFADDLESFKALWRCPVMPSAQRWSAHLEAAGCDVLEVRELSQLMRPRSESETSQAIKEVQARRRWRDLLGLRRIGEAEIGGLLLEKLIRERVVSYQLILGRKRH